MFKTFQMIFNPFFTLFLSFTLHYFDLRRNLTPCWHPSQQQPITVHPLPDPSQSQDDLSQCLLRHSRMPVFMAIKSCTPQRPYQRQWAKQLCLLQQDSLLSDWNKLCFIELYVFLCYVFENKPYKSFVNSRSQYNLTPPTETFVTLF